MDSFEHVFFSRFTNIPSAPPMDVTHPCRVKTQPGMMIFKKRKKGEKKQTSRKKKWKKKEQKKEDGNCKKEGQLGKRKKETKIRGEECAHSGWDSPSTWSQTVSASSAAGREKDAGGHSPNGTAQPSMHRYPQERWLVKKQGEEQYVLFFSMYRYFSKVDRPVD